MDDAQMQAALKGLFREQLFAVLATRGGGAPHLNIVCFAPADELRTILFATPRQSLKFANLQSQPEASLFVDNRSNRLQDLQEVYGVEIAGTAATAAGPGSSPLPRDVPRPVSGPGGVPGLAGDRAHGRPGAPVRHGPQVPGSDLLGGPAVIRRARDGQGGLLLEGPFLQAWLEAAGLRERLAVAFGRLPPQAEPFELWDLWLEIQAALLAAPLEPAQELELLGALEELGEGSLRVRAILPESGRVTLEPDYPDLRGSEAVLEGVRLAWAAVLSAAEPGPAKLAQQLLSPRGSVSVEREHAPRSLAAQGTAAAHGLPARSDAVPGPGLCLLRLAELHNRLMPNDPPARLQALLDLRPWVDLPSAAPDVSAETGFLRAAEAAGRRDAAELLECGRRAWAAWVTSDRAGVESGAVPPGSARAYEKPRCRQLAGSRGAPGLASGPALLLRPETRGPSLPGRILVCRQLEPGFSAEAVNAAGLLTEEGGRLSYGAVLADRAGIPCVCGARGALECIRDGDVVALDGALGIAAVQPGASPG